MQEADAGAYSVTVRNAFGSQNSETVTLGIPDVEREPQDQSVSLGADVEFSVEVVGFGPFSYQWQKDRQDIPGATEPSLELTEVEVTDGGSRFRVRVKSDSLGEETVSREALLEVDDTFEVITDLAITADPELQFGVTSLPAWGDYDDDGNPDLFLPRQLTVFTEPWDNRPYRNMGEGGFLPVTEGPVVSDGGVSNSGSWGDYDNDGDLDLFVVNWSPAEPNFLYENAGGGSFRRIDSGVIATDRLPLSPDGGWIDYDNDGWLDLFVATWGGDYDALYRNNLRRQIDSDELFVRVTDSPLVQEVTSGVYVGAWSDIDRDGDLDVLVTTAHASDVGTKPSLLFRNDRDNGFFKMQDHPLVLEQADSNYASWGDYDNDGDFDLFVATDSAEPNFLFKNDGDWNFTKINEGPIVEEGVRSGTGHWVDYDNDGDLDLFVANGFAWSAIVDSLFRNEGEGHFTKVTSGSLVNEPGQTMASWVDYNNDGFLDLFVSTFSTAKTRLYRNNLKQVGPGNHWIKIQCIGTHANRSGIGTQIIVTATIRGDRVELLRTGLGDATLNGSVLPVHFGLGDATIIETIRIEWPGPAFTVQELHDVPVDQLLEVIEPPQLSAQLDGAVELRIPGWAGTTYRLEVSSDLVSWEALATLTVTDPAGGVSYRDDEASLAGQRYYRVVREND